MKTENERNETTDESGVASSALFSGKIHDLKTDPEVFDAVARGEKTFEIRKDDRGFNVGDTLLLRRTRYTVEQMHFGDPLEYTGEQETRTVTHIIRGPIYGLADGWAILSLNSAVQSQARDERS